MGKQTVALGLPNLANGECVPGRGERRPMLRTGRKALEACAWRRPASSRAEDNGLEGVGEEVRADDELGGEVLARGKAGKEE